MTNLDFLRDLYVRMNACFDNGGVALALTQEERARLSNVLPYARHTGVHALGRTWLKPVSLRIASFERAITETVAERLNPVPWTAQDGRTILVRKMGDNHLMHTVNMIREGRAPYARTGRGIESYWRPVLENEQLFRLATWDDEH